MTDNNATPATDSVDVLVIGAGPAGIASAYALEQAGISYRVIDRANTIGSTWDRLYPSLHLNTSRFFSHMPGMKFPLRYGIFASGRDYHQYLLRYVDNHDFNIHLGIDVERVVPEDDLWRVESSEGVAYYPAIISATGVFNNPIMPDIPGLSDFKGDIMHASDFRHEHSVTGRRLLVVGNGPSGVDIAVASTKTAHSVRLAIRSGILVRKRFPGGLPKHAWMMIGDHLPPQLCARLMQQIGSWQQYHDQEVYGLPAPDAEGSAVASPGHELVPLVQSGAIRPVPAPIQFYEYSAEYADGTADTIDTVIMATGYEPVLHQYLDIDLQVHHGPLPPRDPCDWDIGPNGIRGWPLRDVSQHPNGRQVLGHPGLYLVGTYYKGRGAMFNFNVEARIAAQQIQAYLANF